MNPTPPATLQCADCGAPLAGDYCTSERCRYFHWPQFVEREDISVFTTEEVEEKYHVLERADASVHHAVPLSPAQADARREAAIARLDDRLRG